MVVIKSKSNPHIVLLNDAHFVANGGRCFVFRHPEDDNLLIKVTNPRFLKRSRLKDRFARRIPVINRYRLSKCYIRELIESVRLRFTDHYCVVTCLQQVVGLVDTNLGCGLVVRAERDKDHRYAKTLRFIIQTNQFNGEIQKKLDQFYQALSNCDVAISDCAPPNVVYAYNETEGDHFVLIDGIGEKTLIPILRFSAYLRKKSRLAQIKRLKQRVASDLEKYTSC